MIKVTLNNKILKRITSIEEKRFSLKNIKLPQLTHNKLRKNSKKKSSYALTIWSFLSINRSICEPNTPLSKLDLTKYDKTLVETPNIPKAFLIC